MKKSVVLLLATASLFVGCEPVPHYNRVKAAAMAGEPVEVPVSKQGKVKPYGSVKLFQNKSEVTQKYKVLALMTVSGDPGDEARFITAFLYRAADMGADGVVLDPENKTSTASTQVNFGWVPSVTTARSYRAEANRFEQPSQ